MGSLRFLVVLTICCYSNFHYLNLKIYQMGFCVGSCDPNQIVWDVARLKKSIKKSPAARQLFLTFQKLRNIPSVWITVLKHQNSFEISFIK